MLTREDQRQRVLANKYRFFSRIQTGGASSQLVVRMNTQENFDDLYLSRIVTCGAIDAPDYMPAGSMCSDWQRECKRP